MTNQRKDAADIATTLAFLLRQAREDARALSEQVTTLAGVTEVLAGGGVRPTGPTKMYGETGWEWRRGNEWSLHRCDGDRDFVHLGVRAWCNDVITLDRESALALAAALVSALGDVVRSETR